MCDIDNGFSNQDEKRSFHRTKFLCSKIKKRKSEKDEEPYQALAREIVTMAIEDWKKAKYKPRTRREIEKFFISEWCDLLLQGTDLTGEYIIEKLKEREKKK